MQPWEEPLEAQAVLHGGGHCGLAQNHKKIELVPSREQIQR